MVKFIDGEDSLAFGAMRGGDAPLSATVFVQHPQFYSDVALGGTIGAAEAYMQGRWTCDDLTSLMRLLVRNCALLEQMEGWAGHLHLPAQKLLHAWRRNSRGGSRSNIAAHYDLGNDFFRLFLDETLTYSCGIFESATTTIRDASLAKIDRICRKLQLAPHDHLLEIGTGWGALAIRAAQEYGCRVTTTTISRAQYDVACQRVDEAGLSDRVHVECQDYRDLTGRFDKLVSIEMIEAVGREYLDEYLRVCDRLLKPEGIMALQAILIPDRQFAAYARSVDFIQRYVFPGGFLPSLGAICQSLGKTSELQVFDVEDISAHYARTLNVCAHDSSRTWRQFRDWDTRTSSCGCGSFTSATAKPGFWNAVARVLNCCSSSRAVSSDRKGRVVADLIRRETTAARDPKQHGRNYRPDNCQRRERMVAQFERTQRAPAQ